MSEGHEISRGEGLAAPRTGDGWLIRRYLQGEREAVAEVDCWIETAARPYARRLSSQWDDVAQEIRMKVFRLLQSGSFRGESSLKTYLWRVVNNTCIDAVRAGNGHARKVELDSDGEVLALVEQQEVSDTVTPEVADLVLKVLEQVPDHCKRIWRLILAGFSYREMSRVLELSENALRVRALRCRERAVKIRRHLMRADGESVGL